MCIRDSGTSDYERAIEKAQKAIRQHSIKRRPIRKPGRAYTDEYKKWLARREFNPFIHRAWLLLGKAQYQKGDFPEAASTFSYIVRLYDGQTNITSEALIWLSLSLIHISEPTRQAEISYAVFCLKKKNRL